MIAWGHSAVGASVGVITYSIYGADKPVEGLIAAGFAGTISHYVCDFIPHGHIVKYLTRSNTPLILFLDLFLGVAFFFGLDFYYHGITLRTLYILLGIGGTQLPDIVSGLSAREIIKRTGFLKMEYNFHQALHWHGTGKNALLLSLNDVWQLVIVVIAAYLLIRT